MFPTEGIRGTLDEVHRGLRNVFIRLLPNSPKSVYSWQKTNLTLQAFCCVF